MHSLKDCLAFNFTSLCLKPSCDALIIGAHETEGRGLAGGSGCGGSSGSSAAQQRTHVGPVGRDQDQLQMDAVLPEGGG